MSKNIHQIFIANPITTNASTDLMYFGQSPYGAGNDAAMTYANFSAQFGAPFTPAALTEVNDTNVILTLGGTPSTALLQATSITAGWTGTLSGARGGTGVANTGLTIDLSGGATGKVLTSDSSGNATWQTGSGGGGPWSSGLGIDSGIGGDGSATAFGSYALSYGNSNCAADGNNSFAFGTASTIDLSSSSCLSFGNTCSSASDQYSLVFGNTCNSTGNNNFVFGSNNAITSAASCGFIFGQSNNINNGSSFAFAFGTTCNANANVSLAWGENCTTNGTFSWVIGSNNTSTSTSSYGFIFGDSSAINNSATFASALGESCNANADYSLAKGNTCTASGVYSWAIGNFVTTNNDGSYVWGDSNFGPASDTANDQWVQTFAGGYYWYNHSNSLAVKIDTTGNLINKKGTSDQSYSLQAPNTGFSITIANNSKTLILHPSGTLATGTVIMPAAPIDGQEIRICTSQTITALTVNPNSGQSLANPFSATLTAGTAIAYIYNLSGTTWYNLP